MAPVIRRKLLAIDKSGNGLRTNELRFSLSSFIHGRLITSARKQAELIRRRRNEQQPARHRGVLQKIEKLRNISRGTSRLPEGMAHERRWHQEGNQGDLNAFQRYTLAAARVLMAAILLANGFGIIPQTLAAKDLAVHGTPAALVPLVMLAGRTIEIVGGFGLILGIYPQIPAKEGSLLRSIYLSRRASTGPHPAMLDSRSWLGVDRAFQQLKSV